MLWQDKLIALVLSLAAIGLAIWSAWASNTPAAIASVTLAISAFPRTV